MVDSRPSALFEHLFLPETLGREHQLAPTIDLAKKRGHSEVHDIPEARESHFVRQTYFGYCHNDAILTP